MPYKSKAQRAYLHIHEPKIAAKWDRKYGGKIAKGKKKTTTAKSSRGRKK
jgi:hypothetical protein